MVGWGGAVLLFISASPVVVVTDQYEVTLYGKERIQATCVQSSLGIWKPLRLVHGEPGEDPERLVLKIGLAARRPSLVLFPSWFYEGALHYTKVYPQVPVGVWFSEKELENETAFLSFPGYIGRIDYRKDMENLVSLFLKKGLVDLSHLKIDEESWGGATASQVQAALEKAIQNRVQTKKIPFGGISPESYPPDTETNAGSLWIMGPGSVKALAEKGSYVWYSWQDPRYVPPSVVVLLDDSRWPHLVSFARDIWERERQKGERQIWYPSVQRFLKK